ncbi:AcrR family transcriptional regulator [Methylobacterium brachiatum]|uniref:AcrR family transcriptional regulator n=1 Tax=Methylobacterium brachiatum TaxID=269660 RepID=A0AAJ1U0M3_9HYPH|nr:TetR/AcrR family transcriptional regulator [Methylobacterium brachiatum]MCB4805898.1 TetR/AcrR family transcriptional regulator [Methylobacterium brachiatum]MDQ0547172.1 AcrR family transcriptional regulator [Methylobacterium brachiatum]
MNAKEVTKRTPSRLGRPPRGSEGDATLRILAAAKPVFLSEGYEAASIDAIAGSAGISKKTIYARFSSKEDLFEAVIVRFIEENVPAIESAASQAGPVAERLHRIALATLEVALSVDSIAVRRIIVAEAARFPEFARLLHDFGIVRVAPLIERCLEEGNASGEIAVDDVRHTGDMFLSIAIRGFVDMAELGLERPGMSHVKRETLKRCVDFFMAACREGLPRTGSVGPR